MPEVAFVTILAEPILVISADFVCHFSEIYISFELRNFVASKSRVGTELSSHIGEKKKTTLRLKVTNNLLSDQNFIFSSIF